MCVSLQARSHQSSLWHQSKLCLFCFFFKLAIKMLVFPVGNRQSQGVYVCLFLFAESTGRDSPSQRANLYFPPPSALCLSTLSLLLHPPSPLLSLLRLTSAIIILIIRPNSALNHHRASRISLLGVFLLSLRTCHQGSRF